MWYHYKQFIDFSIARLERLSEIAKDIGQVFFAVLSIEAFTKDHINWKLVFCGLLLSSISWSLSIISFNNKKI